MPLEKPLFLALTAEVCAEAFGRGALDPVFAGDGEDLATILRDVLEDGDILVTQGAGILATCPICCWIHPVFTKKIISLSGLMPCEGRSKRVKELDQQKQVSQLGRVAVFYGGTSAESNFAGKRDGGD